MLARKGKHIFTFQGMETVEVRSIFSARPDAKVQKLKWKFTSNFTDDETGEPETYDVLTGMEYGNERAGATKLVDQLWPDGTYAEKISTDFEKWKGRQYEVEIVHEVDKDGQVQAKHLSLIHVEGDKSNA